MDVVLLADRPDLIAPLAAAYEAEWPEWYGPDGPGDASADLTARARRGGLPLGLVLVEDGRAVGAAALTATGVEGWNAHLGPWVGGGWVEPALRRRGLGLRLLEAAADEARRLGFARLYVATATAASLIHRAGWSLLETDQGLSLFVLEVGAAQLGPPPGR